MFLVAVRTYVRSFEQTGYPIPFDFAMTYMFSSDTWMLFISDAILVLSTAVSVPFAQAVSKGWINYYGMGQVIQHLWQTMVLAVAIKWTFDRSSFRQYASRLVLTISNLGNGHGCNPATLLSTPSS